VSRSTEYASTNCEADGFVVRTNGQIILQCRVFTNSNVTNALAVRGSWTHIAVTYNRSLLRVFVNGVRRINTRLADDQYRNLVWNSDIWLGQDQDAPNANFEPGDAFFGSLDDVVWYGHAIPDAEVPTLMTSGFPARDVNYEFCDALDNDCSLGVDNTHIPPLGDACVVGMGVCAAPGFRICAADGFGTICDGTPGTPSVETCNGLDDDCDGLVDEDWTEIGATCSVGVGACRRNGVFLCSADGSGTICSATPGLPSAETCDNVDNDCDGDVDDNVTRTCFTGPSGSSLTPPSACRSGTQACAAGVWGTCVGQVLPSAEICDDIDWDCDGNLNNGFNAGQVCTNGQLGECARTGAYFCDTTSSTACSAPTVVPGTELCGDGLDNDCDGETDEGTVVATVTVDAVQSGDPAFDYSTCDITDGSATMCSAVTFTIDVAGISGYAVPSGSPLELLLAGATPLTLSSGLTLPRTVGIGTRDTFTYCWDNSAPATNAKVIVEVDTGCNTLASNPATTPAADLIDCGPEFCDGGDNNGDGRVDELPDACFGNPTLTCVNDSGRYSCVPTLEDGTPACADEGCEPSGDGSAAIPPDPSRTAAAAAAANASGADSAGSQAGCGAAGAGSAFPVALAALPLVALLRRRRRIVPQQ
jgi:uncharacterized protein (TIGR03382 family)